MMMDSKIAPAQEMEGSASKGSGKVLIDTPGSPEVAYPQRIPLKSSLSVVHNASDKASTDNDSHVHKMGLMHGVLVPTCENMWGVLIFLRLPVMVGNAGLLESLSVVILSFLIALLTAISVSAVATNSRPRPGGAYTMISRSLGPEIGLVVGLMYYFGVTLLAVLESVGASSILLEIAPGLGDPFGSMAVQAWSILMIVLMSMLVYVGLDYVTKVSVLFIFVVVGSILSVIVGILLASPGDDATSAAGLITGPNLDTLQDNLGSSYQHGEDYYQSLALFFPCFTGILAGANRMEALESPFKAVPRGTIGAVVISLVLYTFMITLWATVAHSDYLNGAVCPDEGLAHLGNETHRRRLGGDAGGCNWLHDMGWPTPLVLQLGIVIASLSQALQCIVVAPSILEAIAADKLLSFLSILNGSSARPLIVTMIIASAAAMSGAISVVAPILSMCFLHCYTAINLSVLVCALVHAANWRPRFRYFHWSLAGLGFVLCLSMMFLIDKWIATGTIILAIALYLYAALTKTKSEWGSGITGLRFRYAMILLYGLDQDRHMLDQQVNWRPQLLVFLTDFPEDDVYVDDKRSLKREMPSGSSTNPQTDYNQSIGQVTDNIAASKKITRTTSAPANSLSPTNSLSPEQNVSSPKRKYKFAQFLAAQAHKRGLSTSGLIRGITKKEKKSWMEDEDLSESTYKNFCLLCFVKQLHSKSCNSLCAVTSTCIVPEKSASKKKKGKKKMHNDHIGDERWRLVENREKVLDSMTYSVGLNSFSHAVSAPDLSQGRLHALQALKIGCLRPNTVIMNFPDVSSFARNKTDYDHHKRIAAEFCEDLRNIHEARDAVLICKGVDMFLSSPTRINTAKVTAVHATDDASIDAEAQRRRLVERRRRSLLRPRLSTLYDAVKDDSMNKKRPIDVWWVIHDGGLMLYMAHLLKLSKVWTGCAIRLFTIIDPGVFKAGLDAITVQSSLQTMVNRARIDATAMLPVQVAHDSLKLYSHKLDHTTNEVEEARARAENDDVSEDPEFAAMRRRRRRTSCGKVRRATLCLEINDVLGDIMDQQKVRARRTVSLGFDEIIRGLKTKVRRHSAMGRSLKPEDPSEKNSERDLSRVSTSYGRSPTIEEIPNKKNNNRWTNNASQAGGAGKGPSCIPSWASDTSASEDSHTRADKAPSGQVAPVLGEESKACSDWAASGGDTSASYLQYVMQNKPIEDDIPSPSVDASAAGSRSTSPVEVLKPHTQDGPSPECTSPVVALSDNRGPPSYRSRATHTGIASSDSSGFDDLTNFEALPDPRDNNVGTAGSQSSQTRPEGVDRSMHTYSPSKPEYKKMKKQKVRRSDSVIRLTMWADLNHKIQEQSADASLVILNLPTPMEGQKPLKYVHMLEELTNGLPRVLFCHGSGREIIATD